MKYVRAIGATVVWWLAALTFSCYDKLWGQEAKDVWPPPGATATTYCAGGRVGTWIDAAVIGTDSATEILEHEKVHRRQFADSVVKNGVCPIIDTPAKMLMLEVEAYCVSFDIRSEHQDPTTVRSIYVLKLMREFGGALPPYTITHQWTVQCGK